MVNKKCEASTIVEMVYLIPVILLTWMLVVFALFYYHDKNIIAGAAYETAIVGSEQCQQEEIDTERLQQYFQDRVRKKLLFFPYVVVYIEIAEKQVTVTGSAYSKGMEIEIEESAAVIMPEKKLRKIEMIKNGLEELGE